MVQIKVDGDKQTNPPKFQTYKTQRPYFSE